MTQALTVAAQVPADLMEKVVIGGDLSKLTAAERLSFYKATCDSLGLNPLTRPFQYIVLNGKLQLYAAKDCTEQLRRVHGVSVTKIEREMFEGVYTVTAYVSDKTGRTDASTGAVSIENLKGEAKANAMMKAETKAKRRGTLSICGLGILDETEIETIVDARQFVETAVENHEQKQAQIDPKKIAEDIVTTKLQIIKLMELPVFTDEQRSNADWFIAEVETKEPAVALEQLSKKLLQVKQFVQKSSKDEAKKQKQAAKSELPREPEQQTLSEPLEGQAV